MGFSDSRFACLSLIYKRFWIWAISEVKRNIAVNKISWFMGSRFAYVLLIYKRISFGAISEVKGFLELFEEVRLHEISICLSLINT